MGLTPKQKRILDFILEFSESKGYAPSQREIAEHFGFRSLGTVQNYMTRLQSSGYLEKEWNSKRGLKIKEQEKEQSKASLPLLGKVAAGKPIEALFDNESIDVPDSWIDARRESFILEVQGDSMIDDGILDGDFIVVQKQRTAENGQSVVALLRNEATLKRYYKRVSHIELHSANAKYKPIIVRDKDDFQIEGVLKGVLRKF